MEKLLQKMSHTGISGGPSVEGVGIVSENTQCQKDDILIQEFVSTPTRT